MGASVSMAIMAGMRVPASAYADSTFGTDEGGTAGTYTVKVSVTIIQSTVRTQALTALRRIRQDAYDENITLSDGTKLRTELKSEGISESSYVNIT